MNTPFISAMKTGITTKGISDPNTAATPVSISTDPRYIGFLLRRKALSVTRILDSSWGLTVVLTLRKILSATMLIAIPMTNGKMPSKFQGEGMIVLTGNVKWSVIITASEINKYVGGNMVLLFFFVRESSWDILFHLCIFGSLMFCVAKLFLYTDYADFPDFSLGLRRTGTVSG